MATTSASYGSSSPEAVVTTCRSGSTVCAVPSVKSAPRAREQAEVEVVRALETEGLGDGERPVPEVALGSDEFDVDHPPRERVEPQCGLERGDATAGDDDAKTSARG